MAIRPLSADVRPALSVALLFVMGACLGLEPAVAQGFSFSLEKRLQVVEGPVTALAVDPRSRWLAVASEEEIRILALGADGMTALHRLEEPTKKVRGLSVSPDGQTLAVVDGRGRLYLYDSTRWALETAITSGHRRGISAVGFTLDGRYLVTGGDRGGIEIRTADGQFFAELTRDLEHDDGVVYLAGTGPGRHVVSVGEDRQIFLWDVDTQRPIRSTATEIEILSAALGGGDRILALGLRELTGSLYVSAGVGNAHGVEADDRLRLIDLESGTVFLDLGGDRQDLSAIAVSPDGRFVAAGGSESYTVVRDVATGDPTTRIPSPEPVTVVRFSDDGQKMFIGDRSGAVQGLALEGVGPAPRPVPAPGSSPIIIVVLHPEAISLGRSGAATPLRVSSPTLVIRGRVSSTKPLSSLQINGQEITSLVPAPDDSGSYLFRATVPLSRPGLQDVRIVAENQAGTLQEESFSVERAERVAVADPTEGRRLALLVGISRYDDPSINLEYADDDAQALYDLLTSDGLGPSAFRPQDVRLLVNEEATATAINTGLREFLQRASEKDTVLFFFAGHGVPDPHRIQDLYLMAHDTNPNNVAGTGLLMRHVREAIAQIPARNVLILTDACHSAGMAAPKSFRNARTNPIHARFLDKMRHSSGGLAILTASEAAQASLETKERGHGLFTFYLLEGLKGRADTDQDSIVSLGEIMEYVRENVRDETQDRQVPAIGPTSFDRHLPLAIVGSQP